MVPVLLHFLLREKGQRYPQKTDVTVKQVQSDVDREGCPGDGE